MTLTRRGIQLSLGGLWLLDGLLQWQPFMFTRGFANSVLHPTLSGQPAVLAEVLRVAQTPFSVAPVETNLLAAVIQVLLGVGLLRGRHPRAYLLASMLWGVGVWSVGEGWGGVFAGTSFAMGAPGAALLYVLLALLAWPHDRRALSSALVAPLWASVWVLNALLQFVSVHSGAMSLSAMAAQAESGAPGLVSRLDQWFARGALPGATSDVLAGVFLLVGLWGLLGGVPRRASAGLGAFLALASWVLFQGAGDLTSGRATDPNSGPLYLLFALALWSVARQSGDATMTIDDRRDGADDLQTEEAVSFLARATPRVRLKDRAASTLS